MIPLETSPVYFAEEVLKLPLYPWQDQVLTWFEDVPQKRVKGSLCTPNGAGKSERVVATLVLYWLALFPKGKVIVTTKSGLQLETQIEPALKSHRGKFPDWKFIERKIETPTGGQAILFVTDEVGRAEGHHPVDGPFDGPVLVIVDEAKSVPDDLFAALDRNNYAAILYVSSPGQMQGRFYESQFNPALGFKHVRVGLLDCPHISKERVDDIIATYGPDSPFTRSTLYGEFMEADGEARFDRKGLFFLRAMANHGHALASRGVLQDQPWQRDGRKMQTWSDQKDGWIWMQEAPKPKYRYIGFCDPMTGEQSEGSKQRDTHAAGIIRAAYSDDVGKWHDAEVVSALYSPSEEEASGAACRWDNDVLADRFAMLLRHYGNCPAVVEANNSGTEVIRLLMLDGCNLWRREKPNHRIPGKQLEVVGFLTTSATKNYWIGALNAAVRERLLGCKFLPAVKQMETFILNEKGTGEAQAGCHDDWIAGIGMGLLQINAAQELVGHAAIPLQQWGEATILQGYAPPNTSHGACG